MSSLARVVSNPCSSITFNYVKSVHVLANRTSQAEVPNTAPEHTSRGSRGIVQVDLTPRVFVKNPANFQMHPEKLKQIIKEKDGQIFCNYLCRDGYKKRKRCLTIMEKRKKLMQATSVGIYLVRLPKTTPEGYRVLVYAVRDNDPTKMNFSDCIKGFCMYNDCVLSEDGLQEGYIVIFDMKGVQLGHLARVSLPALRCFMLYIQEAHPCRLKGIHILNTASWIHHVMRLVVPLVRSELLNLVQFHKGNVPEGFPLDLLPNEYGGEAPTMEDLDNETKSMVHKYQEWLIETGEWKSDESKRVKKASWWGLFNGSNKTSNVELDEKTILKNLQID